jgi:hypothetical protein
VNDDLQRLSLSSSPMNRHNLNLVNVTSPPMNLNVDQVHKKLEKDDISGKSNSLLDYFVLNEQLRSTLKI